MTEETKADRQQGVQHYISTELSDTNGEVIVSYHLTSIYDHSTLEAFSKVSPATYLYSHIYFEERKLCCHVDA